MQFNVNDSVVKMLELIAQCRPLQALIVLITLIVQLPDILRALALFIAH